MSQIVNIKPVDNWRFFYRKYSFYIIGAIPVITAAQSFIPEIQELMPAAYYGYLKGALAVAGFIASQIKQPKIAVTPEDAV